MAGACPVPGPDDPLVRGLLGVVDCNVQTAVQTGYASLFQPGGAFVGVLSVLMTVYVAMVGFRLMRGDANLNVSELAITAVKLGAVLALATQWGTYQALVYRTLFQGPEQIADIILHGLRSRGSVVGGNVYDGLQRAFTDLTAFSPATPPGAAAAPAGNAAAAAAASGQVAAGAGQLSTLLSKAGFDSLLLLGSAVVLLLTSLGVLLATKVVLAILLAVGPFFIALLLFDTTRGLFEGWLRAALGFAFAPLATTLTLGLSLTMLDPSLQQLETMRSANTYLPGVAFGVTVLVAVFAMVSLGLTGAGGAIAAGFRPVRRRSGDSPRSPVQTLVVGPAEMAAQPRAVRIASAAATQARRDAAALPSAAALFSVAGASGDRRTAITNVTNAGAPPAPALDARIGQRTRRSASPRAGRAGPRGDAARAEGPALP